MDKNRSPALSRQENGVMRTVERSESRNYSGPNEPRMRYKHLSTASYIPFPFRRLCTTTDLSLFARNLTPLEASRDGES